MAAPKKKNAFVELGDMFRKEPAAWDKEGIPYEGHFTRAVFNHLLARDTQDQDLTEDALRRHDRLLQAAFSEDRRTDGKAGAIAAFQASYDAHASNQVAESKGRGWDEASVRLIARFLATPPSEEDIQRSDRAARHKATASSPYKSRIKEALGYGLALDRPALDRNGNPDPTRGELANYLIHTEHLATAMESGWKPRTGTVTFNSLAARDIPQAPDHDFTACESATIRSDVWGADNRPIEQRREVYSQFSGKNRLSPYRLDERWDDMNTPSYARGPKDPYKTYPGHETLKASNLLTLVEKGYLDREAIKTVEFITAAHQSQNPDLMEATKDFDVNGVRNADGETALHVLMRNETPKDHKYHGLRPALRAMRDYGLDPFQPSNMHDTTPLEIGLKTINSSRSDGKRSRIVRDPKRTAKYLQAISGAANTYPLNESRQPAYMMLALLTNDSDLAEKSGLSKRMAENPKRIAFDAARLSELTECREPLDFFRTNGGDLETLDSASKGIDNSFVYGDFTREWSGDIQSDKNPVKNDRETRVKDAAMARRERLKQRNQPSKTRNSAPNEIQ